ncbi:hypothetical protein OBBRIDRAFT_740373 [Obba rivulosa]|uniref:CxC2-like cysteine cluster KDZ transposase-associated domain-containing protein n=1 Tax=Obba rivulosa TaxID=1052685 RepID=A0A8E2AR29_9APHY|nr:hypothetical protein OBBRIDRAFT_740373 [Obba rivulosa]
MYILIDLRCIPDIISQSGISDKIAEWQPHFDGILGDLLAREADPGIPGLCSCGGQAIVRCLQCVIGEAMCKECIKQSHHHHPFHWVDVWEDGFFKHYDLYALDLVLDLGHQGRPCPHRSTAEKHESLTVVHTNGVHKIAIHQCHCPGRPPLLNQLILAGLFPGTVKRPASAFTVELLREWHIHALVSKKSAYNYVRALYRLSDNAFPSSVKDRYREFNVISRIWRHLTMLKRAGHGHKIVLPGRPADSLAVPCFGCPSPGFNMPDNWKDTPKELSYIHRIFLGGDGNHSLQKKAKHDDPDDISLAPGKVFFIDHTKMAKYLAEASKDEALETCSGFKVARSQRPGKFRHLLVSGIVAISCIRHACFRAQAVVDLQKGERYAIDGWMIRG